MPAKAGIHALPAIPSIQKKQALLFCEQKRSKKNVAPAGCGDAVANVPKDQNFFASPGGQPFCQKRSASFPPLPASAMLSPAIGSNSRD
jgi:hypothetical protein